MFGAFAKQGLVYGLSGAATRVLNFLLLPLYARILLPGEYGAIDLLANIMLIATTLAYAGTDSAYAYVYHRCEGLRERASLLRTLVTAHLGSGLLLSLAVLGGFEAINQFYAKGGLRLEWCTLAMSCMVASFVLTDLRSACLFDLRPWRFLAINVTSGLLVPAGILYFVMLERQGVGGYYWGTLAGSLATLLVLIPALREMLQAPFSGKLLRSLASRGLTLFPSSLAAVILMVADRFFIVRFGSLADVGLYGMACRLSAPMVLASETFRNAWWPLALAEKDPARQTAIFGSMSRLYLWAGLSAALLLGAVGRPLLIVLVPDVFVDSSRAVGLIACAYVLMGYWSISSLGIWNAGKHGQFSLAMAAAAVLDIGLTSQLVPRMGFVGAALSLALAELTANIVATLASERVRSYKLPVLRLAGVTVLTGAVLYCQLEAQQAAARTVAASLQAGLLWSLPCIPLLAICLFPFHWWRRLARLELPDFMA